MVRVHDDVVPAGCHDESRTSLVVIDGPCTQHLCLLQLVGPFRAPVDGYLRHRIRALLRGGVRSIILDFACVSRIDAAGIGELVRAYNMTTAANSVLQIVQATARVREILDRVHLYELLAASREYR